MYLILRYSVKDGTYGWYDLHMIGMTAKVVWLI